MFDFSQQLKTMETRKTLTIVFSRFIFKSRQRAGWVIVDGLVVKWFGSCYWESKNCLLNRIFQWTILCFMFCFTNIKACVLFQEFFLSIEQEKPLFCLTLLKWKSGNTTASHMFMKYNEINLAPQGALWITSFDAESHRGCGNGCWRRREGKKTRGM